MGLIVSYDNKEISFSGCPGCAYAKHSFELSCGIAYEDDKYVLSQDWELPIKGFFVLSSKKCVDKLSDFSNDERNEMFSIVDKTIKILKDNFICDSFNVIFEEKLNKHFHIWIMPRSKWMNEITDDIIDNIALIFEYAKKNFRNEETYSEIKKITQIVKDNWY